MSLSFNSRVRGRPFFTALPMPNRSASFGSLGSIGALICKKQNRVKEGIWEENEIHVDGIER